MNLIDLPFDCLYIVYSYLSGNDIISLRKVCTYLAEIAFYYKGEQSKIFYGCEPNFMYGFYNNVLLESMKIPNISRRHEVTCMFDVNDICAYNGARALNIKGRATNLGVVDIDVIHSKHSRFTNFNKSFQNVKELYMYDNRTVDVIEGLHNMTALTVSSCYINLKRVSNMKSLTYLNLIGTKCDEIMDLPSLKVLMIDNVNFGNLDSLEYLQAIRLNSTPTFKNLKTLNMRDCLRLNIDYISSIKTLVELDISGTNVTDVSGLTHIRKLNISYTRVNDISMLTEVEELNMSYTNVTSLPPNNKIIVLEANRFIGRHLDNINNVTSLSLSNSMIETITMENIIDYVNVSYCDNFSDMTPFHHATYVNAFHTKVSVIPNSNVIREINLSNTPVESLEGLENAEVVIALCTKVKKLPDFTRIKTLYIDDCEIPYYNSLKKLVATNVPKLNHLTNLTDLNVSNYKSSDICDLVNLVKLCVYNCNKLDVSTLTKLEELTTRNTKIENINTLVNLTSLNTDIEDRIDLPKLKHVRAKNVVITYRIKAYNNQRDEYLSDED